jgi:alpha-glucuronidase
MVLLPSRTSCVLVLALLAVIPGATLRAETGRDLWLRYVPVQDATRLEEYRRSIAALVVSGESQTGRLTATELRRGFKGLLARDVPVALRVERDGVVLVGTPERLPAIAALGWASDLERVGAEGYLIRSAKVSGHAVTVIASTSDLGAFRGSFHFLRLLQTARPVTALNIAERPRMDRRLLNHWDNLDGSIERGYAGGSLWNWAELPGRLDPRLEEYARANASVGINGAVLNNVNADPAILTAAYLEKVAALARVFRPYGIRVYLSANFAAPHVLGHLPTADPLDGRVARWWRDKASEIYRLVPDFGGFLVKANSEGQPGPQDYGRTHADGANVLADALAPHGGIVMWRAFVYSADVDPDRVKRAYLEFVPLDGRFRDNVIVQAKNGPLDFQPREPFSPLFGAMPRTPLMAELQITQEYLGHSVHLVYLAPMWKEALDADTYAAGHGSPVRKVIDGSLHGHRLNGIAGVANTGTDPNWTGHDFAQANWYAYGRLAWNPDLTAEEIADEWIAMTWSTSADVARVLRPLMLESREVFVNYTMPLGLHHLIGGDHYAPMPENPDPRRADWSAIYYHRADARGIGFDRTRRGSNAVAQYRSPLREQFEDPATCPEKFLLWFHRLPWDHRLSSGRTLWEELARRYHDGADRAASMVPRWASLRGKVDDRRHEAVLAKLQQQVRDAANWRDKCLEYFQQFSRRPIAAADPARRDRGGPPASPSPRVEGVSR